ncbi:MAG: DUF4912 domain-containing protein [Candidatus Eisenbacteria bacterium]|nr:DUF4912 domain-containing protein [Candidatus Eisenbacteria bacterium]
MKRKELEAKTKPELLALAQRIDLPGRSSMTKDDLVAALVRRRIPSTARRSSKKKAAAKKKTAAKKPAARKKTSKKTSKKKVAKKKAPPKKSTTSKTGARKKSTARKAATRKKTAAKKATAAKRTTARRTATKKKATKKEATKKKTTARKPAARKPAAKKKPAAPQRPEPVPATPRPVPPSAPAPAEPQAHLPGEYGEDYAGLMVRDPEWLYVYWEVTPEALAGARERLGPEGERSHLVLRILSYAANAETSPEGEGAERIEDVELPEDATSWYVQVPQGDRLYGVAVGLRGPSGAFQACVTSNVVRPPRGDCAEETDEEWASRDELLARLSEMLDGGSVPGSSPALGLPPYRRPADEERSEDAEGAGGSR